jgi:hypothetical protein
VSKPTLYLMQQILRGFMRFIGATMAGLATGICVLLASMLFRATPAFAATVIPLPQLFVPAPIEAVLPAIAAPNVPRKIVISSGWLNNCGPVSLTLNTRDTAETGILVVRAAYAAFNPIGAVCIPILPGDPRLELVYTPAKVGVIRIVVASDRDAVSGEGSIVTSLDGKPRSTVDISGLWFDVASSGSGVTFQHSFSSTDLTFGTWYLYDQGGRPRWYTMQNAVWNADGRSLSADLLESRAPASSCPVGAPCPLTATGSSKIGSVKISLTGEDFSRPPTLTMKIEAASLTGAPLFSSTLTKLVF